MLQFNPKQSQWIQSYRMTLKNLKLFNAITKFISLLKNNKTTLRCYA